MLRDQNIPVGAKGVALGLGVALTALLVSLEVPLETLIGFVLPIVGIAGDVLIDGAEMIIGPLLFASLILPFVVPIPAKTMRRVGPTPPETTPHR